MNEFDPNFQLQTITIVGLGGTGCQIARSVARMIYDMKLSRLHPPQMVLIDPDVVEMKNVGRQLFTQADVGQPKAQVLMRRFNTALGLNISAIAQPVDAGRHFDRSGNLIVGAVDNHLARCELAKVKHALWIDAGNHFSSGQVVCGNIGDRSLMLRHLDGQKGKYYYLPNAGMLFPALLEPESESQPKPQPVSCAELVASREQDLLINDWLAVVASQYIYKFLHRQPVASFMSYISSDHMSIRSLPICREELVAYLQVEG